MPYQHLGDARVLTLIAPEGGVTAGLPYLYEDTVVIATGTRAGGVQYEGLIRGHVVVPKTVAQAWAIGDAIAFDSATALFNNTGTGIACGIAATVAINPSTTGQIVLGGGGSGNGSGGLPAGLTFVSPCLTVGADIDNAITVCGSSGSGLANPTTIATADADQAASITIQPGASNDMLGNNGGDLILSSGGPPAAPGQLLLQVGTVTGLAISSGPVVTANGIFQVGGDVQNQVVITGSTTGNPVEISSEGSDSAIPILLSPKGSASATGVYIGTPPPNTPPGGVIISGDSAGNGASATMYSAKVTGNNMYLLASRGTLTVPLPMQQFDIPGGINFGSWSDVLSAYFYPAAEVFSIVEAAPVAVTGEVPTSLQFSITRLNGSQGSFSFTTVTADQEALVLGVGGHFVDTSYALVSGGNATTSPLLLKRGDDSAFADLSLGGLTVNTRTGTPAKAAAFDSGGKLVEVTGASGTFTTVDLKTVTVLNGIITSIVP